MRSAFELEWLANIDNELLNNEMNKKILEVLRYRPEKKFFLKDLVHLGPDLDIIKSMVCLYRHCEVLGEVASRTGNEISRMKWISFSNWGRPLK